MEICTRLKSANTREGNCSRPRISWIGPHVRPRPAASRFVAAFCKPTFRSKPVQLEEDSQEDLKVRILFVGESNVCRSIIAEACARQLLSECGLSNYVDCASKGTRDYNEGEEADPAAVEAALELMMPLPKDFRARRINEARDIVEYDMLLVMDKYTAADVLREVSVFDTINKGKGYSRKVRRLGEFHPVLKKSLDVDGQDIDDPLYGNMGGTDEQDALMKAAKLIESSCLGLIQYLQKLQQDYGENPREFRDAFRDRVLSMEDIDWLVPPMLQPRKQM